ncbi:MAG: long-chain fatty acid--CoA ligase [Rhodospirillaceae bacterium]|nr:long-chain fatty acid--CoA ligase [Rhodospirillaceae bacterium]
MLIGDLLTEGVARNPDKVAIVAGDQEISYKELDRASNRVANALTAQGYGKGHIVAILSTNQLDYGSIFFGVARSGGILAHLPARFSDDELSHVVAKSDIELIFVHAPLLENLNRVSDDLPAGTKTVIFGGNRQGDVETLENFLGDASTDVPSVEIADTDPFAITFTGGTTGFPKCVMVNHASRVICAVRAQREYRVEHGDVVCCSTPLFHIAGLFVWFITGIKMGNICHMMPAWDASEFIEWVENKGISSAFLVPTQINSVLSHENFTPERVRNLRYVNYGGSPTSTAQLHRMLEVLPDVVWEDQYGQSEAGNMTIRPPEFILSKPKSVGRPFQDIELAALDADGNILPAGEPGEVSTRGINVMMGYYKDAEKTAETITEDGWLKTGDVGYFDEDGFLFLVDRSKEMIISGGENIFPTEIEGALYQHEAVNECAVFGIPDDHWGELPAAHVVLEAGKNADEQELIDFCAEKVARFKRPRMIKIVESLPKTAVGKIQKTAIKEKYWQGKESSIV